MNPIILLLAAAYLLTPLPVSAQIGGGPGPGAAPAGAGCQPTGDASRLGTSLPLPLIDYLEGISGSAFAHAFLLSHVAENGNPEHWLTRCADAFIEAQAGDVQALRETRVGARAVLRALRAEERARIEEEQIRAAARLTITDLLPSLRRNLTFANVEIHAPYFRQFSETACSPGPALICDPLRAVRQQIEVVGAAEQAAEQARVAADRQEEEVDRLRRELQVLRDAIASDSVELRETREALERSQALRAAAARQLQDRPEPAEPGDTLQPAEPGDTVRPQPAETLDLTESVTRVDAAADSSRVQLLEARLAERAFARDSLARALDVAAREVETARQRREAAELAASSSLQELDRRLVGLDAALRTAGATQVTATPIDLPAREQVRTRIALVDAPPVATTQRAPRARSSSLFVEVADFVFDRAKQELVLTYLANLYPLMRDDPALQGTFRETYELMRGLATPGQARLSATAAGLVPLPVWRATLSRDFIRLPLNIVQTSAPALCGTDAGCRVHLAQLRPLGAAASRLLAGDPVFQVLRDAPLLAAEAAAELPPYWAPVVHGLGIVAGLVETYQVQGFAPSADPGRHPYILTAENLERVPGSQRDAFARLLLVGAAPPAVGSLPAVDDRAVTDALRRVAGTIESLASFAEGAEPAPAQAAQVLRASLSALAGGVEIAASLAPATLRPQVATVAQRWSGFAAALEPFAARDYGLALSRGTVFVGGITEQPVSRNLLTVAALASNLAEAQTADQVRAAFEAAATPAGGWQAKRYREGSRRTITAFPGLALGNEWLFGGEAAPTVGVSLPIGAEFQLLPAAPEGTVPPCTLGVVCSVGVFVPIVDLGALLTYRLGSSEGVASAPNTSFRQVIAPGAYLSLGLWRTAASLLVGGQIMPSIRKVTATETDASGNAFRLGVGIVLDVTLLQL